MTDSSTTETEMGEPVDTALRSVTQVLAGYQPGFRLVNGQQANSVERFTVVPARGTSRLLLPMERAAMTTALKSFVGGHRWAGLAPTVLQVLSKTAGSTAVLSRDLSLLADGGQAAPIRDLFASVLGRSDFELAFRLSVGRPNAKTVAMAIGANGNPLCFAKFGSENMTNSLVEFETKILQHFQNRDLGVVIPRVLYAGRWAGDHHVLVTEPFMLSPLKRHAELAHRAADDFTKASPMTTSPLRDSDYWQAVVSRVGEIGDRSSSRSVLIQAVEAMDRRWGSTEFDFGYSHGDWSRANLGTVGDKLVALDWERCTDNSPRGIDIAHFAIIENSSSLSNRLLDLDNIEDRTRHYLDEIGRSPLLAQPLIAFDLVEMMLRFSTAQAVGLPSHDSRFGPALRAAMLQWGADS